MQRPKYVVSLNKQQQTKMCVTYLKKKTIAFSI